MKRCPTCDRTFEDSFTFCLIDGSVLSAPFDLKATPNVPEPRRTEPPPTEVINQEIPHTIASPQPEREPEEVVTTIAAPAPAFESPERKVPSAQAARRSSRSSLLMLGVGALLAIGLVIFIASNRGGSTNDKTVGSGPSSAESSTGEIIQVTDSNYERVVANSRTPVLLHFRATWSEPDRKMNPVAEAIAREYAGRVRVGKVDFDGSDNLKQRFSISSVPTFVILEGGIEQERLVGPKSIEEIRQALDKHIGTPHQ
jgi:thiol-disulfide isomerase/thioredoxin